MTHFLQLLLLLTLVIAAATLAPLRARIGLHHPHVTVEETIAGPPDETDNAS